MAGTKIGGMKAKQTNLQKYGEDFYKNIGKKGGRNGHTGGFASNPALASVAGAIGGRKSRRGPVYDKEWHSVKPTVQEMLAQGYSIKEIADFTGLSYSKLIYRVSKEFVFDDKGVVLND
jgi:hypothetical protein